jgi:2',3'-cyclic-nucleotide 2'-phosphodiesterase (5'-nucleotidase family)
MRILLPLSLMVLAGCSRHRPGPPAPPDLLVFYASGVRGAVASPATGNGGMARRATLVDRARVNTQALLQVDAGDLTPNVEDEAALKDVVARASRTRLVFQSYRRMGVDVVTLGETDWALGSATLQSLAKEEKVKVVAANVLGKDGKDGKDGRGKDDDPDSRRCRIQLRQCPAGVVA